LPLVSLTLLLKFFLLLAVIMSLSWGLDDLAAASGAAMPALLVAFGSSAVSSGKSRSDGSSGGKLVALALVRSSDNFCLGFIGSGKAKICLSRLCSVQAHVQDKFGFAEGVDALIFIDTEVEIE
jgi:hypothetical protein